MRMHKKKRPVLNRYVQDAKTGKFIVNGVPVAPAVWRKCEEMGIAIKYGVTERDLRRLIMDSAAIAGANTIAPLTGGETYAAIKARYNRLSLMAAAANGAVFTARANAAPIVAAKKQAGAQLKTARRNQTVTEIADKYGVSRDVAEQIVTERENAARAARAARKAGRDAERAIVSAATAAMLTAAAAPAPSND